MAYVKNTWVDQDVERPKTYEVTNNQDGSITLTDSFGLVTELGTPVNGTNMNHIESGIDGCAIRKHNLTETFNLNEWVLGGTGDAEGLYKSKVANNVGNAISDKTKWERISLGASRNIGEIVPSAIPLSDAGLHLLDGALINGTGIYAEFVDYISSLDLTANYFCTEADWQQSVTDYGVCGKFVYDSVNNTVRLPKITGIVEGTTDLTALGDLVEAGLPNITGNLYNINTWSGTADGAFAVTDTANRDSSGSGNTTYRRFTLNASNSSSIYGNSTTVQPQTIKVLFYICVATSAKTDIEVDIDDIVTDLNGKADVDLTNANNQAKVLMSKMGMPSDTYTDLVLGTTGANYTAPANGWVYFKKTATAAGQYVEIANTTGSGISLPVRAVAANPIATYCPVSAGDTFSVGYTAAGTTNAFRFIYAQGSESEAS